MPRRFNDLLALLIVLGVPVMITITRWASVDMPGEAVGTFIGGWLLIIQHYYRKAGPTP